MITNPNTIAIIWGLSPLILITIAIILQIKCKNVALKTTLQIFLFFPLAIYNIVQSIRERG